MSQQIAFHFSTSCLKQSKKSKKSYVERAREGRGSLHIGVVTTS